MDKSNAKIFRTCRKWTIILCLFGLGLSYYSIFVSNSKREDPSYRALCDISEKIGCSKVLTSVYSKGFGIIGKLLGEDTPLFQSNGVYGLAYYTIFMILSFYPAKFLATYQLFMSIISIAISAYLGYILIYILDDLCIVCVTTYAINFVLFLLSVKNYRAVKAAVSGVSSTDYSSVLDGRTSKKRV